MDKDIKISVRINQEQYNFLHDLGISDNLSESIRFSINMLKILVDRGFYCKLIGCTNVKEMSDNNLNINQTKENNNH